MDALDYEKMDHNMGNNDKQSLLTRGAGPSRTYTNDAQSANISPGDNNILSDSIIKNDSTTSNMTSSTSTRLERCTNKRCFKIFRNIALCVMNIFAMSGVLVTLPLVAGGFSHEKAESDSYVALLVVTMWFPIIYLFQLIFVKVFIHRSMPLIPTVPWSYMVISGSCLGLGIALTSFAAVPTRTPPYLQAILQTLTVPFTVLARLVIVKKGINIKQVFCVLVLLVGLFVTLEPTIWDFHSESAGDIEAWYFPVVFAFTPLPMSLAYVYMEKAVGGSESELLLFVFWFLVCLFGSYASCFWMDFIPCFGMAESFAHFGVHLKNGFECFYKADISCGGVTIPSVLLILAFTSMNLLNILQVKYTEGSVFLAVVNALATPVSTFFWYLFTDEPNFAWMPYFDTSTIFVIIGMVIMVPSIVMYAYFGDDDENEPSPVPEDTSQLIGVEEE